MPDEFCEARYDNRKGSAASKDVRKTRAAPQADGDAGSRRTTRDEKKTRAVRPGLNPPLEEGGETAEVARCTTDKGS